MARNFTSANLEYFEGGSPSWAAIPVSMHCWVKPVDADSSMQVLGCYNTGQGVHQTTLGVNSQFNAFSANFRHGQFGVTTITSANDAVTFGSWNGVGGKISAAGAMELFVNGASEGTGTNTNTFTRDIISIGRHGDSSPSAYLDGDEGESAIWNIDLTAAEFAMLGLGYSPLFIRPANLVFYSPQVNGSGDAIDRIGGVSLTENNTIPAADHPRVIMPSSQIITQPTVAVGGRVMSSLVAAGGLAGRGGIAGIGGGLAR